MERNNSNQTPEQLASRFVVTNIYRPSDGACYRGIKFEGLVHFSLMFDFGGDVEFPLLPEQQLQFVDIRVGDQI
ncbi:MAG: hypothetical protein NVS1B11_33240 [Terriglobales bacterium]